jgi:MFS family permease
MKPRLPASQITSSTKLSFASFKHPLFLFVAFSNLFQGLGYFIPGIYLPSYASDLNIPSLQATLLLSLLNLALVFGQIGFGALGDKMGPTIPLMLSAAVAGLSVTTLWGLSKSFPLLTLFSIIYGASAGGYSVLWSKIALEVSKDDPYTQLAIWGFYTFER